MTCPHSAAQSGTAPSLGGRTGCSTTGVACMQGTVCHAWRVLLRDTSIRGQVAVQAQARGKPLAGPAEPFKQALKQLVHDVAAKLGAGRAKWSEERKKSTHKRGIYSHTISTSAASVAWCCTRYPDDMKAPQHAVAWDDLPLVLQQRNLLLTGNPCARRVSKAWRDTFDAANDTRGHHAALHTISSTLQAVFQVLPSL